MMTKRIPRSAVTAIFTVSVSFAFAIFFATNAHANVSEEPINAELTADKVSVNSQDASFSEDKEIKQEKKSEKKEVKKKKKKHNKKSGKKEVKKSSKDKQSKKQKSESKVKEIAPQKVSAQWYEEQPPKEQPPKEENTNENCNNNSNNNSSNSNAWNDINQNIENNNTIQNENIITNVINIQIKDTRDHKKDEKKDHDKKSRKKDDDDDDDDRKKAASIFTPRIIGDPTAVIPVKMSKLANRMVIAEVVVRNKDTEDVMIKRVTTRLNDMGDGFVTVPNLDSYTLYQFKVKFRDLDGDAQSRFSRNIKTLTTA